MGRQNHYPTFRAWLNDESIQRIPISATVPVTGAVSDIDTTTTSLVDVVLQDMVISPGFGDWIVFFDGSVSNTDDRDQGTVSIYVDGTKINHSTRQSQGNKEIRLYVGTRAVITGLSDGQTIDVRWNVLGGTGTFHERTLTALKIK